MSVKEEHFPIKLKDSIILRPYARADASIIFHTVDENREHLQRWFPWVKATQKVEDSLEFLTTIVEDEQQKGTGIHLGIFDISIEEEKLLGAVAIRNINLSNHSGEVSYTTTLMPRLAQRLSLMNTIGNPPPPIYSLS